MGSAHEARNNAGNRADPVRIVIRFTQIQAHVVLQSGTRRCATASQNLKLSLSPTDYKSEALNPAVLRRLPTRQHRRPGNRIRSLLQHMGVQSWL